MDRNKNLALLLISICFITAEATACFTRQAKKCVNGANIFKYTGKTVEQCKKICAENSQCVAFEFGVAYGGAGSYKAGDCQPQSSSNSAGCDGTIHNLDLYVKKSQDCEGNGRFTAWSTWGDCSENCGDGIQKRTRTCTNTSLAFGGSDCHGVALHTRPCKVRECPVPIYSPSFFSQTISITKNNLLATISKLGVNFIIKFEVYPLRFQPGWTNVIHVTAFGGNLETYGYRLPGVWFFSDSPSNTTNRLHICSAINNNSNHCYNTSKVVPHSNWSDIEISQLEEMGYHRYQVKVRGQTIGTIMNKEAKTFSDVKVYAGNDWDNTTQGYIRGLTIVPDIQNKNNLSELEINWSMWKLVRHIPRGQRWHRARDQLRGTEAYGNPCGPTCDREWTIKFHEDDFDQFLFSTGDKMKWLIADRDSVIGEWYADSYRTVYRSSANRESHRVKWYRRKNNVEDPWISLTDHHNAIGTGDIVYGEASYGGRHASAVLNHNGANVYIRKQGIIASRSASITLPQSRPLIKNTLLGTIEKLGTNFIIKFQVYPLRFQYGLTNVIHFTAFGGDHQQYGDRTPAVWFWSASPSDTTNRLHICSAINNNRNHCYNTNKIVPRNQWSDVEITQLQEGNYHLHKVKVRNQLIGSVINKVAKPFANVEVYISDGWYNAAQGYIRGLTIVPVLYNLDQGESTCSPASFTCEKDRRQDGNDIGHTKTQSRDECARKCCENKECIGFDWVIENQSCSLSNTSRRKVPLEKHNNIWSCEKKTVDKVCWRHVRFGCVKGGDIANYNDKTLPECKELCRKRGSCKAVEYGVNHGGNGEYKSGLCNLKNKANYNQRGTGKKKRLLCNGRKENLDIHIRCEHDEQGNNGNNGSMIVGIIVGIMLTFAIFYIFHNRRIQLKSVATPQSATAETSPSTATAETSPSTATTETSPSTETAETSPSTEEHQAAVEPTLTIAASLPQLNGPVYHLPENAILISPGPPTYMSLYPEGRVNLGADVEKELPPPYIG